MIYSFEKKNKTSSKFTHTYIHTNKINEGLSSSPTVERAFASLPKYFGDRGSAAGTWCWTPQTQREGPSKVTISWTKQSVSVCSLPVIEALSTLQIHPRMNTESCFQKARYYRRYLKTEKAEASSLQQAK